MEIIVTTEEKLKSIVRNELKEHEMELKKTTIQKFYTINKAAKKLGMSFSTVKKRIAQGMIKTTQDGRISENSLNEYLKEN